MTRYGWMGAAQAAKRRAVAAATAAEAAAARAAAAATRATTAAMAATPTAAAAAAVHRVPAATPAIVREPEPAVVRVASAQRTQVRFCKSLSMQSLVCTHALLRREGDYGPLNIHSMRGGNWRAWSCTPGSASEAKAETSLS